MEKQKKMFTGIANKPEKQETHSCCGGNGNQHRDLRSSHSQTIYQCPMKCEGDKTYNAPGICPVCNMHLSAVN